MICCVTLNPAVDRTARVPKVLLGEILRPTEVVVLPGGKGINVARAARTLGAQVVTTGVVGGHSGRWMVEELAREGLNPRFIDSGRENRTTYVVAGDDGRTVTVYENGIEQPEQPYAELVALIERELLAGCEFLVIAGSMPPGVDPRYLGRIVAACTASGVRCLVDARGASLRAGLEARATIVKANRQELVDGGLGRGGVDPTELARAAVAEGAGAGVVTLGAGGAVACDGSRCWRLTVPRRKALTAVGAGDVFTAGLVVALTRGRGFEEALRHAGAAAAASVSMLGAGRLDHAVMDELLPRVHVRAVV